MKKINVGISIAIKTPTESLFTNGIRQNIIILKETLSSIEWIDKIFYINFGPQKDLSQSPWKEYEDSIVSFSECLNKVNLIICAGVVLGDAQLELGKKNNIKFVQHVMGNEFYAFSESVLFKDTSMNITSKRTGYSATWISPHLYENNKNLFEVLNDCESEIAPYIWSPKFLLKDVEKNTKTNNLPELYKPSGNIEKRINVFEPNIGMNKTCISPIISLEKFYKKKPELLQRSYIFGSTLIKNKKDMINFAINLEINKNKKLSFEDRYPIAWSLMKFTDIVLSYQKDCELNYLYFDAAWLGYPVIHNSSYLKDFGWYYSGTDSEKASEHLIKVASSFDKNGYYKKYLEKSRKYISNFLPDNQKNIEGYSNLIDKVLSQ